MLRPSIMAAPGHEFVCGDWSSIEARVLPWLADDREADWRLGAFADGVDMYVKTAEDIWPGEGEEHRQEGKVAELSMGYGGGAAAYVSMARQYGVRIPVKLAEGIKVKWREANPWATRFWGRLETAALNALKYPGNACVAGRIYYVMDEPGERLRCMLPSGRELSYPQARREVVKTPWGAEKMGVTALKANWTPAAGVEEWPRVTLYGGLQAENVTQAVANDIQRHGIRLSHDAGWPVVGHTHDELLWEVRSSDVEKAQSDIVRCMETIPDWAEGLPLDVKCWTGPRYRK